MLQPIMTINVHVSTNTEPVADVVSNSQSGLICYIPKYFPMLLKEKKRKGRGKTTGLSVQNKRKGNDNGKLKVIIPQDRTVAVGPGAIDFVTELSVKVLQHARHDVKKWKKVPNLARLNCFSYTKRFKHWQRAKSSKTWEMTHMKSGHWVNDALLNLMIS
ncbi:uncharacterized protein LOC142177136 [Nicotiana tabacum]|uniref:Uncharacterized protein LOC142177136 n=1 Tax=Nicotiana tabacum TaxID=4097 RepID=A0AC58TWV9_TOBAC